MPRKQRFKPSRKPKLIPTAQAQDGVEIGAASTQSDDETRVSDGDLMDPAAAARAPQYQEQGEP